VVGVLAALLENLQQLPNQSGRRWEEVLNKVKIEARKGGWHKLDFSEGPWLWPGPYTWKSPLEQVFYVTSLDLKVSKRIDPKIRIEEQYRVSSGGKGYFVDFRPGLSDRMEGASWRA
jgi:hypothetical protein